MGKHLVLIGGGHAHMVTLANLDQFIKKGHKVSVVGPSDYHYYSGMGPGMLGGTYSPEEIRFNTKHVVEKKGGIFIRDRAVRIDPYRKNVVLESGATIPYDLLSCNAGSYVPSSVIKGDLKDIFFVKPIEKLMEAKQRVIQKLTQGELNTISIVGGGPSSAEIAGNVRQLIMNHCIEISHVNEPSSRINAMMPQINIFAGKKFMSRFPDNIRKMVMRNIKSRGINIFEDGYVKNIDNGTIMMESGRMHQSDFIFVALGVKPSAIFKNSGLPTGPDQGLVVNKFLQNTQYPEIFGGGDCIYFQDAPLDKVGVYAVRQNPVLFHNLMAYLDNEPLQPFDTGGEYLLIFNLGGEYGVLKKKWFSLKGKSAFVIKDYIDRKFMQEFQAS